MTANDVLSLDDKLLNYLMTAVIVIDSQCHIRYANSAAEQLFAINRHKLTELNLIDSCHLSSSLNQRLATAVQSGDGLYFSAISLVINDGQPVSVDLTLSPLPDNGLAVLELKQVDQQRRIHQQLNQDAQQQAAQFLVRNLAHEIKNPLGGLRGAAQLLDRELNDPQLQEFTSMIIEQADRLRNLVDRLLGPQRPSLHSMNNIHQVTEKVLRLVAVTLPPNISLQRDYDPSIPDSVMDPEQLQQALLNLLQNAIQAMAQQQGTVTVRTRTQHQVTLGEKRHKLVMEIKIIDNGPGIADALMDTLFYPMVSGKADGNGLGLSIAHNIVRLHGGRIDCVSQPGHTEFTLLLPLRDQGPQLARSPHELSLAIDEARHE
ncbi:nitrogen regulation protein NR(II) [Shewanella sp. NIFS-20-20]|uniref:nitrogen regulation protein NR(II) n=1 Tax=Shewanella sp. NIFS-20-20 TaxID=2853806 RepID=UPI001C47E724|nr:nitrogen regulation protein NR(II) [Shewanella sp. NIFS-20-20]MBV7317528.1 nitrogen regulation protein NR(II) [Shewanella sp. NIFS-20-20]